MSKQIIDILYTEVGEKLSSEQYSYYAGKMPHTMREKINRFMRWQNRQASLFGKLLLMEGVMKYGYPSDCLNFVSLDKSGRPFLDNNIDFNISHSGEYVICAISRTARVGVDIERITKRINLAEFKHFMGIDQFNIIREAEDPYCTFYELWTKNESVIKADGKGLSISFSNIINKGEMALLSGTAWFLKKIQIDLHYSCHLAANIEEYLLELRKIGY